MEEENFNMKGYHGTCSKHYESIKEFGFDPEKVKKRNDHWLGQGVYFFEMIERALWWANDQSSKNYNSGTLPMVYEVDINAPKEQVLNLDLDENLDAFYDFVIETFTQVENSETGKYPVFDMEQMRAVYFDYYKMKNNISVIIRTFSKATAKYAKFRTKEELKKIREVSEALGLGYYEKQICVSDKECIKNIELVYNGEYEVI